MLKTLIIIILFVFQPFVSIGQYSMDLLPPTSPKTSISKQIGFTDISINYSSPSVKGRQIWGELVPFDEIWRAGADYATVLELSDEVFINNVAVDSGKYALFVIPHETEEWEVILNSEWKQWGAFRMDSTKNIHTFKVKAHEIPSQEQLTYTITSSDFSTGKINLAWDKFSIRLDLHCSTEAQLENRLKKKLELSKLPQEQAVLYLQLAEFYEKQQINKNQALRHILLANSLLDSDVREWNKQYYPLEYVRGHMYFVKAKILYWDNEKELAMQEIERCKALHNSYNYYKRNEKSIQDWLEDHPF